MTFSHFLFCFLHHGETETTKTELLHALTCTSSHLPSHHNMAELPMPLSDQPLLCALDSIHSCRLTGNNQAILFHLASIFNFSLLLGQSHQHIDTEILLIKKKKISCTSILPPSYYPIFLLLKMVVYILAV